MDYKEIASVWLSKLSLWMAEIFPSLLLTAIILLVALKLNRFLIKKITVIIINKSSSKTIIEKEENTKRINTLTGITRQAGNLLIWGVFGMIILGKLGLNLGPILTSAGIVGLAIGFGAQELVRDLISGFFILLENQIRTGDVGIINGTSGLVEKIELRTITLRDFSGVVHVFQNGKINSLSNITKEWSAIVLDIGVSYHSDVDEVMEVMKSVGDQMREEEEFKSLIIEPIEILGLDKFDSSSLIIKIRITTKPISQWMVGREYRKRLKLAFDQKSIEIPFPQTTITWGKESNPFIQPS